MVRFNRTTLLHRTAFLLDGKVVQSKCFSLFAWAYLRYYFGYASTLHFLAVVSRLFFTHGILTKIRDSPFQFHLAYSDTVFPSISPYSSTCIHNKSNKMRRICTAKVQREKICYAIAKWARTGNNVPNAEKSI